MDEPKTSSVKALKKELERIDERAREKCAPCRIVLGMSVVIFLSVSLYAFVEFSKTPGFKTVPLAPELYPPIDPKVTEREMLELGQLFHPELSSSTPVRSFASPVQTSKNLPIKR